MTRAGRTIGQAATMLVYSAAAFCVFLVLLNRRLILLSESRTKRPIILLVFLLITGGSGALGLFIPVKYWILIPVTILCLVGVGETRRIVIRQQCAGSAPIDTIPHRVALTRPFTTTDLVCHRYQVSLAGWRGAPFRVVHLTDLHANPRLPFEFYQEVFSITEAAEPDLLFLTGDFISDVDSLSVLSQFLRPVGKFGSFAVLGNHDYWTDAPRISAVLDEAGIVLMSGKSMALELDGGKILLSGYDYPWGTKNKEFAVAPGAMPHVVLTHTADNIYNISRTGAGLVFCGHYHAGHIRLPFLGPIVVPSLYGRRFDHGHFVVNGTHLFVASGVGSSHPPFRIYCQPDIFVLDVAAEAGPAA